jgi:hypothetical protein
MRMAMPTLVAVAAVRRVLVSVARLGDGNVDAIPVVLVRRVHVVRVGPVVVRVIRAVRRRGLVLVAPPQVAHG